LLLDSEPRQPRALNPKVDRDLSAVCLKCLEKNPKHRYPSALELAEDLERWLWHEPIRAKRSGPFTHLRKWVQRNPLTTALIMVSVLLAIGLGMLTWERESDRRIPAGIAVLPFENLSDDKSDAFFADGVQDDILTKLAKIADLKVISRTSVMGYRGKRDVREIGRALGVSHVLEGTARRSGGRVRVNAQLVDTRTDVGVWADEYETDLKQAFAIPSEIAQKVAEQLHAKVSAAEKASIQQPPTSDLAAYDLYVRANNLLLTSFSSAAQANLIEAADLLNQAVARDSSFFHAYCQLAHTHGLLYLLGVDHTPERLKLMEQAVQTAVRLRPNAGEANLARAENLYFGYLDYDGALAQLELARRSLPNNLQVYAVQGYIQRRQGRWDESTRNLERAIDLDPRNFYLLQQIAISYGLLRRYSDEISVLQRALAIEPDDVNTKIALAAVQFHWKGDTGPLHRTIDGIRAKNPGALPNVANDWLSCALAERNVAEATNALNSFGDTPLTDYVVHVNRPLVEGVLARLTKDEAKAHAAFTEARIIQEKAVQNEPDYGPPLCVLGLIDAALGRKEDALRGGRRAVELLPVEKDAINGPLMIKYLAMIAAWIGDKELACEQLAIAVRPPSTVSYGQLKLEPNWDPLRGDPRFESIVDSLAPK
jgi:TolB-like protein/Flp pilus assembly protein TadD